MSGNAPGRPTLRSALARVQFRVMLLTLVLAALGGLFSSILVVDSYVREELRLVGGLASYSAEPAIVFQDRAAMREAVQPLADSDGIRAIVLTTGDQRIEVRHAPGDRLIRRIELAIAEALWPQPAVVQIRHGGQPIGEARVYAGFGNLGGYLVVGLGCGLACLALALSLTYFLSLRLQRRIAAPLQAIASVAHQVRVGRALHLRAPPAPIEEIHTLGEDFNALLGELEGWQDHLRSENAALAHRASHDALTGLANRAVLEERLATAIGAAGGAETPIGLLYLDANRFKRVNDRFGHMAGDALLREIADRLRHCIRRNDLAARFGGDEFAVLMTQASGASEMAAIAERIHAAMREPVILPDGSEITCSVSIGMALFPRDGTDAPALLRAADEAMYASKRRDGPPLPDVVPSR
ncbi:MAG: diguanylate cyclase [Proteobacteria bacterium]|nr:diguanylate cyclase [Pseudomonadota bacterium]